MTVHVWPSAPLPLPRYRRVTWCRLNETRDALFFTREREDFRLGPDALTESHGEIYLRLYELDLDDHDAILGFVGEYSVLDGDDMYQRLKREGYFSSPYRRNRGYPAARRAVYERARYQVLDVEDAPATRVEIETLLEFRLAAMRLQSVTAEWFALSTAVDKRPPRMSWHTLGLPYHFEVGASLAGLLPVLLRTFTPYVGRERPVQVAPLYEVCGYELFNHIAEGPTYRRCENCGRLFVRQHGRAEHGQSRSQGVKYCDYHCSQAAAARAYRKRERAKRAREQPPEESG